MGLPRYHYWIRETQEGCRRRDSGETDVPPVRRALAGGNVRLSTKVVVLVRPGLFRRQVSGLSDSVQIQTARRKLGYLPPTPRSELHLKHLGADHAARGAFIHGKEAAAHPVPTLVVVAVVNSHHHFQLWLPPEARAVWWGKSHPRVKVCEFELPIAAIQINPGLVL